MKTVSSVYAVSLAAILCAILSLAAASPALHSKARTTRGFKNAALSTARGFGKRAGLQMDSVESLPDPSHELLNRILSERTDIESFPVDWLAEEMVGNPELARLIISRFIDRNQDGDLSADELLRTSY